MCSILNRIESKIISGVAQTGGTVYDWVVIINENAGYNLPNPNSFI